MELKESRLAAPHLASDEIDGEGSEAQNVERDQEFLLELTEYAKANQNRYPPAEVLNIMRDKLNAVPCKNQGYVLDGYPVTSEDAASLFQSFC